MVNPKFNYSFARHGLKRKTLSSKGFDFRLTEAWAKLDNLLVSSYSISKNQSHYQSACSKENFEGLLFSIKVDFGAIMGSAKFLEPNFVTQHQGKAFFRVE